MVVCPPVVYVTFWFISPGCYDFGESRGNDQWGHFVDVDELSVGSV